MRTVLTVPARKRVVELYQTGLSSRHVAERFGVCPQTVMNILREAGSPIRSNSQRGRAILLKRAAASAADSKPFLSEPDLRHALNIWARGTYSTADIASMLLVEEAAVANSIGRFHGFTQGRAA